VPGRQPEPRAPIIDKIVFGIEPAVNQLPVLVGIIPWL